MTTFDNLKLLINALKDISFWGRIFGWKRIKNLLIDAAGDLSVNELKLSEQNSEINSLTNERQLLQQEKETLDQRKHEYENEIVDLKRNSKYLQEEIERLQKVNTEFSATEESRRNKYEAAVSSLEKIE